MLTAEWHRLFKTNQTVFWEKRAEFFSDPDNAFNCENCPDPNKELAGKYPCGDSCLIYDHARVKANPGELKNEK